MKKLRSSLILERPTFCFNRAVFKSMGYGDVDLDKPLIGVANTWSELVPGSYNLRALAERVKQGIYAAGGTPFEFGVIGCCDGTAQGNEGMKYILPSREIIANDVEVMVQAHRLDALVLLGSCDKIVPGLLMAAARLGLPAILLPGGPMLGGEVFDNRKSDLTTMSEGCGMLQTGKVTESELYRLEDTCGPTCGSCSFFGTANTMCCLAEALGMTLTGGALIPAVYAERTRHAFETGRTIVQLVREGIGADQVITHASLRNAITVLHATGGSTNAVMHLTAIAREMGIDSAEMMRLFDELGDRTPLVAKVNPSSEYDMEDFYKAGGIPQVMRELESLLDKDAMTATGRTLGENIATYHKPAPDRRVIKTAEEPFSAFGGIRIMHGNLCPEGAVTKPSAIHPSMHTFTGEARVFGGEEEAEEAILAGCIHAGDVIVIRYEGPQGGPGMREMYKAMKYLYGMGLGKSTAVVTDGRFSGTNNGCFVGHISPEASDGGPIALVEDGDRITISIPEKSVTLHVSEETLASRRAVWKKPPYQFDRGYLALYERMASSASRGAVIEFEK
jgi:dihydroxy-acid dehydratase